MHEGVLQPKLYMGCHQNKSYCVSTSIEVILSAVKIGDEKVSIQYLFLFLLRYKDHETLVLFSLDPPASFPYTVPSLTGVTGVKLASLSK